MRSLIAPACALLAACPPPAADPTPTPAPTYEALPASIAAELADGADRYGATSVALAIHHGGRVYAGAVGPRVPGGDEPADPETLYRIGSVTKMMTATAVLAAVDRGDLALDDRLEDRLPGLDLQGVARWQDIELRHLLSHTAGLYEITPIEGGSDDARLLDFTFGGFRQQSFVMAPAGAFWNYSNPNFSLAAAALERQDGRSYREIVQEDVWAPLGMLRSMFLPQEVADDGNWAGALTGDWTGQGLGEQTVTPDSYDDAWSRPSGFAWCSVLDLARFGDLLLGGHDAVLSAERHAALVAAQVPMHAYLDYADYGFGVMRWSERNAGSHWYALGTVEHNGALPGYATDLITVPGHDLVIAVLATADGAYLEELRAAILEHFLDVAPTDFPDPGVDPGDFPRFVGTYQDPSNVGDLVVQQDEDGELFLTMPRLDELDIPYSPTLTPISRDNFRMVVQGHPLQATFLADEGGGIRWLRTRVFVADRGGDARDAARPDDDSVRAWAKRLAPPPLR